jgi:D-alanyl-D-alanine carboxypeptidase
LALIVVISASFAYAYVSGSAANNTVPQTAAAAAKDPFAAISLQAQAAYVYDPASDRVLFSLNPDAQLPLASLVKVPLALAVSDVLPTDMIITIPRDTAPPGSAMRLAAGSRWPVGDVINFTLIASSNTGAEILAQAATPAIRAKYTNAPEKDAALWSMNNLAKNLGLTHTFFTNASGLDVSTTQSGGYGSARDIAHLFAFAASTSPTIFEGTAKNDMLLMSQNGEKTSAINTDKMLGAIPGLVMGKTGLTDLAGGNLAIVFDVGPAHPVVAVVLGSSEKGRFDDMRQLVQATLATVAQ